MNIDIKQAAKRQTLADITAQAERIAAVIQTVRHAMLAPTSKKEAPLLTAGELAELCGTTKPAIVYRANKGDLPEGTMVGNKRVWSMAEARSWTRQMRAAHLRPEGTLAVTITMANFKGGVSKTTTAVTLAQGLAMRGHRVLLVDLDPQGSATTLFGISPNLDVELEHTAALLFDGSEDSLGYAIRPTYWPGVDIVCAGPLLFNAEFQLPSRQMQEPGFEFWRVLDRGLDQAREDYDVILIDTAPMLSYVVINALLAADGVIIPMPPATMDFASSEHFWQLFADLCTQLVANRGQDKVFEFVNVLLARVESDSSATTVVRQWVLEAFGEKVLPVEIPKTAAAATASAEFGTVYDLHRGSIDSKTFTRAKTAFDGLCSVIEHQIEAVWATQREELQAGAEHVA
jgi:chromosome partitioning protein